jgi:hypothetical protein
MRTKRKPATLTFEIATNGTTKEVKATPYNIATGETRFRISVNGGPVLIFAFDEGLNRLAKMEDEVPSIPGNIEMEIVKNLPLAQMEMKQAS